VSVPPAVWAELQSPFTPHPVRQWIDNAPDWLELVRLTGELDPALRHLDLGEREAIALAEQLRADRLLVDEALARVAALHRKIPVIGTLGILRNASIAGLIDLPDALAALQQTSFYASPELIQSLIDEDVERRGRSNQL
jgi:predicted nucleic acid-binding protein